MLRKSGTDCKLDESGVSLPCCAPVKFNLQRIMAWLPSITWAIMIFWLSRQSDIKEPNFWLPPHFDKVVHFGLYMVFSSLLYLAFRFSGLRPNMAALWSLLLASLYGLTDEWHQSMVINRNSDILDWIADTLGAATVFILARYETTILTKLFRRDPNDHIATRSR